MNAKTTLASTHPGERGQAVILVVVAMGIFLLGALGIAIDGSQMYSHREMAQAAADAAAVAGIMTIFDDTISVGLPAGSPPATYTCTTTDSSTPCRYARNNGFGGTASDTVTVEFNPTVTEPDLTLSTTDPTNLIRVTVQRTLATSFMRLLGTSTSTITAKATAAIVDVVEAIPIIVTHPRFAGALHGNGTPNIKICGGPKRSIQVNSGTSLTTTFSGAGPGFTFDISKAGPDDSGTCTTGTGGDFGTAAPPATKPSQIVLGPNSLYIEPASEIRDPFAGVPQPAKPADSLTPDVGSGIPVPNGVAGCPASPSKPCKLYLPGNYPSGLMLQNVTGLFAPGLYYMSSNGFGNHANGVSMMATIGATVTGYGTISTSADTGSGMTVFNAAGSTFDVGANSDATLVGSDPGSTYNGILLFQDRTSATTSHTIGGGGNISLVGTIYITNTRATMLAGTAYQDVNLKGGGGGTTLLRGQIVVSTLSLGGNSGIEMDLNRETLHVRKVALVK